MPGYTRINRRPASPTQRGAAPSTREQDPDAITLFTDGGCSPNPGPGGWGFVVVQQDQALYEAYGGDPVSTNNRMELTALIRALEYCQEHYGSQSVEIFSDSQLSVRIYNEWMAGWQSRGWKRKQGPVENLDLVKQLATLKEQSPKVKISWVKAHAGHRWNEYADQLVWKGRKSLV